MPDPFAEAGAEYLEQVLRVAMQVPAAAGNPASGRIVARLMVALVATGEDHRLDPYLSFRPGTPSACEVRCTNGPEPRPSPAVLPAGQALRAAAEIAADGEHTAEVFASDGHGQQRCVFVTRGPAASYLFPKAGEGAGEVLDPFPGPAELGALDQAVSAAQLMALTERVGALPTTDEVVGALRELLGGLTVEVDATAINDVVLDAVEHLSRSFSGGGQTFAGTELGDRVGLVAGGSPPREATEELARAVVAHFDAEIGVPRAREVADALAPLIPSAAQIADLVAAQIMGRVGGADSPPLAVVQTGAAAAPAILDPAGQEALARLETWMASL